MFHRLKEGGIRLRLRGIVACAVGVMAAVGGMPQAGMAAASPTVAIVAPADSSTVSGTVTVTADVQSDTPIAAVTLEVDGRILASFTAATQYSSQLDTTVLADGDHVLGATAVDAHGVVSTAAAHVVVDNPRSASLVAAYGFDDQSNTTAADASGHGHAGAVNGATWTTGGRFGSALWFDGAGARVDLPALGTFYKRAFTLEAWVNAAASPRDAGVVGSWAVDRGGGPLLWVDHLAGQYYGTLAEGFENYVATGQVPSLHQWQHVAATYDGATARFYIDGVEVASRPFDGNVGDSDSWRIGAYGGTATGFFEGMIDEVRIYNRPLSTEEIHADMQTPVGGTGAGRIAPMAAGPSLPPAFPPGTFADTGAVTLEPVWHDPVPDLLA